MRPRINSFGKIQFKDLTKYLNEHQVYGFIVHIDNDVFIYSHMIMYRNTKKLPLILYVKVSKTSKNVLEAWTSNDIVFHNIYELKKYIEK